MRETERYERDKKTAKDRVQEKRKEEDTETKY